MKHYTVTLRLSGPLSEAVAVEWTNQPAPLDSGEGWEPCLRRPDGSWRFSSQDPFGANPPHLRGPGVFGALAIRYRLGAAGPWSAASESRKEIVILDVSEDGTEELAPPPVAPLLVAAPALAGTGRIGDEVTVAPGLWSGAPAPQLAFQWRRGGTPIPGALGRAYVPGPADDLAALDCQVVARNAAGEAAAVTPALRVAYPAPLVIGELPDEVFDQGAGAQAVETEFAFAGANLTFAAAGAAIDPRSGVLTVPTERAVSGQVVTVTATNSGGAASARLRVTVEALPPRPLLAADVEIRRSLWRPEGQSVTFSPVAAFPGLAGETVDALQWTAAPLFELEENWGPCVARPGEPGAFDIFAAGHPLPAGTFDPALFSTATAAAAARLSRLRFRWRAAAGAPWSEASEALTVPVPSADVPTLPAPTPAMLTEAMAVPAPEAFRYSDETFGVGSGGFKSPAAGHCAVITALAALAYERGPKTRAEPVYGGQTPTEGLREQLVYWSAGDNAPCAYGGVRMQHELVFACTVAIARLIPGLWGGLTAAQRTRLDLAMKGLLVASAWQNSDTNPWVVAGAGSQERTLRGDGYGRGRVPNFTTPSALMPPVVAGYMGGADVAGAFLNGFNRTAFAAEIAAAGGLTELWDTFRQNWTGGQIGPGPTAAELQNAIRNYRYRGWSLAQVDEVLVREINNMWSATIVPGITVEPGETGMGCEVVAGQLGVFEPAAKTGTPRSGSGRGAFVARIPNQAAWAGLPNAGQIGMAKELDSRDGGSSSRGGASAGAGPRSSMGYSMHGAKCTLIATLTLAAQGAADPSSAAAQAAFARQARGVTDMKYRTTHGHRGFANGGRLFVSASNEDWPDASTPNYRLTAFWGMWDEIGAPWARS